MMNQDKPLTIQSDRTMLLDIHSPAQEECREDIIAFSDLIKSPEHIHTYSISCLSLWNAISSGLTEDEIISRLKKWSKYEIDDKVLFFIKDNAERYGDFVLEEYDDKHLILTVRRKLFMYQMKSERSLERYLIPNDDKSFLIDRMNRGTVKVLMIKLGFPVADRIPLNKGAFLDISKKPDFSVRDYQRDAASALLGKKGEAGYGTLVLPCGSGKTVVGIEIMSRLKTNTLVLAPNVAAIHQWKRELLNKTNLTEDMIGEYSSESKEIKSVTLSTYQILTWRENKDSDEYPHFSLFRKGDWGLIIYDEVHMLPAPVFRITAEIQAVFRVGLTATLIREDGREDEVFSLVGPKRYDTPWTELEKRGFIAKAYCHEIRIMLPESLEIEYATAKRHDKYRIASTNPEKIRVTRELLEKHKDDSVLIIGQYLDQLNEFKKAFNLPIITGSTSNKKRDEIYDAFRRGEIKTLIVSKVANFAIDLPDASVAIQISGTYGSRQEEAQRLGRILRPKEKDSHFYTLVTEFTEEEEFAQNRQKFLSEQGYEYTIEKR